jgi:hypothetical protein
MYSFQTVMNKDPVATRPDGTSGRGIFSYVSVTPSIVRGGVRNRLLDRPRAGGGARYMRHRCAVEAARRGSTPDTEAARTRLTEAGRSIRLALGP